MKDKTQSTYCANLIFQRGQGIMFFFYWQYFFYIKLSYLEFYSQLQFSNPSRTYACLQKGQRWKRWNNRVALNVSWFLRHTVHIIV